MPNLWEGKQKNPINLGENHSSSFFLEEIMPKIKRVFY
jgi:hypothetical protein